MRVAKYSTSVQYGPHGGPGGAPPALHRDTRFPSVPTSGVRSPVIHQFPTLGFDPVAGDSIYDKSLTGEPILPWPDFGLRFVTVMVHQSEIYHIYI